jgi:hypothetical protein
MVIRGCRVCLGAQKKVTFLRDPLARAYWIKVRSWTSENTADYLKDEVVTRVAISLAFLGIAVVSLIVFLTW